MANYHLYFFDGDDITGLLPFEAASDAEARGRLIQEADGRGMELWRDGHRLSRVGGQPRSWAQEPLLASVA